MMIFKRRRVKSEVVEFEINDVEMMQPLTKHVSINYKCSEKRRRIKTGLKNDEENTKEISLSEISSISGKMMDIVESIHVDKNNCEINQKSHSKVLLRESQRKDTNENNEMDELKPVNWKLQKLEKKFLLNYLESALLKYDKNSCKNRRFKRHGDVYSSFQSKTDNKTESTIALDNKVKMSLSKVPHKTISIQTEDNIFTFFTSNENFFAWVKGSVIMVNAMESALNEMNVAPLLKLNIENIKAFHDIVNNLNEDVKKYENNKDNIKKAENKSSARLLPPVKKLKSGKQNKLSENRKMNAKKDVKTESRKEHVIPIITERLANDEAREKLDEVRNMETRISENYTRVGNSFQSPVVEDVLNEYVVYKSGLQTDIKEVNLSTTTDPKEIFKSEKEKCISKFNLIESCLSECENNLKEVFNNLNLLHYLLILFNEALSRSFYTVPFIEEVSTVFTQKLSSIQSEAKLLNSTLEKNYAEEIIKENENLCYYLNITSKEEDIIGKLMENSQQFISESTTPVDNIILKIIEDYFAVKHFVSIMQCLSNRIPKNLLYEYFKKGMDSQLEEEKKISCTVNSEHSLININSEILKNFDLFSNALAIILLWNKKNQETRIISVDNISITSESTYEMLMDYHFALTYDIEMMQSDMERMQRWLRDLSETLLDKKGLFEEYELFSKYSTFENIEKLREIFINQDLLNNFLAHVTLSLEVCIKASEMVRQYEETLGKENEEITAPKSIIDQLLEDPALIRQFMSIVNFLNLESEEHSVEDVLEEFVIQNDEDLIKEYLHESLAVILYKLYKLSNWLSRLDKHCIFSDVPQYNAMNEIVVSNILNVIKNDLHPVIKNIFNDSKLLSEVIGSVRAYISIESIKRDTSSKSTQKITKLPELIKFKSNNETNDIGKTEPLTEFPEQSKCKGRNKRYSNSEAENSEIVKDANSESTSHNVISFNTPANNILIDKGLNHEALSLTCEELNALRISTNIMTTDSLLNINSLEKEMKDEYEQKLHSSNELRKSFIFDEKNKCLQASEKELKCINYIESLKSDAESDSNKGVIETEQIEKHSKVENETFFVDNNPLDEVTEDNSKSIKGIDEIQCERFSFDKSSSSKTRSDKSTEEIECINFSFIKSSKTNSLISDNLSFATQMNVLVVKLDETIASIEMKCQTLKEFQMDNEDVQVGIKEDIDIDMFNKRATMDAIMSMESNYKDNQEVFNIRTDECIDFKDNKKQKDLEIEDCIDFKENEEQLNLGINETIYFKDNGEKLDLEIDKGIDFKESEVKLDIINEDRIDYKNDLLNLDEHEISDNTDNKKVSKSNVDEKLTNRQFRNEVKKLAYKLNESIEEIRIISQKLNKLGTEIMDENDEISANQEIISDRLCEEKLKSHNSISSREDKLPPMKINLPIEELNEFEVFEKVDESKLNYISQLNTLASKLEDSVASIDIKYQEMKELQEEMNEPVFITSYSFKAQATINQVIIYNNVEKERNVSFRSQVMSLASQIDQTIALIESVNQELYPNCPIEGENDFLDNNEIINCEKECKLDLENQIENTKILQIENVKYDPEIRNCEMQCTLGLKNPIEESKILQIENVKYDPEIRNCEMQCELGLKNPIEESKILQIENVKYDPEIRNCEMQCEISLKNPIEESKILQIENVKYNPEIQNCEMQCELSFVIPAEESMHPISENIEIKNEFQIIRTNKSLSNEINSEKVELSIFEDFSEEINKISEIEETNETQMSMQETISALGFMVYYLLTLLSVQVREII